MCATDACPHKGRMERFGGTNKGGADGVTRLWLSARVSMATVLRGTGGARCALRILRERCAQEETVE